MNREWLLFIKKDIFPHLFCILNSGYLRSYGFF